MNDTHNDDPYYLATSTNYQNTVKRTVEGSVTR